METGATALRRQPGSVALRESAPDTCRKPRQWRAFANWPPVSEFRFWSLSQTVLARREQFHQSRLVEHLGSWNPFYNDTLNRIQEYLNGRTNTGSSSGTSMAIVNQMLNPSHAPRLYRRVCCAGRDRRGDGAAGPDVAHGQSECWCETCPVAFCHAAHCLDESFCGCPLEERSVGMTASVKVFGCRPHDGGAADTGGRRTQTSKGGNRGRCGGVGRQKLWGFRCWRSVADVR